MLFKSQTKGHIAMKFGESVYNYKVISTRIESFFQSNFLLSSQRCNRLQENIAIWVKLEEISQKFKETRLEKFK